MCASFQLPTLDLNHSRAKAAAAYPFMIGSASIVVTPTVIPEDVTAKYVVDSVDHSHHPATPHHQCFYLYQRVSTADTASEIWEREERSTLKLQASSTA